jgi:hypothetical protein
MTAVILNLELDDDPGIISRDTRTLLENIADRVDPDAELARAEGADGERSGDTVLLGQVAMALISSGSVVALLEIVKSYFNRKRSGKFSVTRADGSSISVEMDDVSDEQFDRTVDRLFAFTGEENPAK